MGSLSVLFLIAMVAGGFAAAAQVPRRAITPEDAFSLVGISAPQLSPDGKEVVFVESAVDRKHDRRVSTIWIVPADGSAKPKRLIEKAPARDPQWSPDGKWLAYISSESQKTAAAQHVGTVEETAQKAAEAGGGKAQVWITDRDGSASRRITSFPNGVTVFAWSPDGKRLAVVTRALPRGMHAATSDVKHYTYMFYKVNGAGWDNHKRSHIWIVPVGSGEPRQLTFGATTEDSNPQWSPDGRWIAYSSLDRGSDLRQTMDANSILVIPSDGGSPHAIVDHGLARDPTWSPDSRSIAYINTATPAQQPLLWIRSTNGKGTARLASDLDRSPSEVHWNRSGLWFGATDHGTAHFFHVAPGSHHAVRAVGGERALHMLSFDHSEDRIAFVSNDPLHPPELFSADAEDRNEQELSFANTALLSHLDLVSEERLNFKGADGWPVQGLFMKPLHWRAGQKYPLILAIHGGPSGMYGKMWEMDLQLYAAAGWAVFVCNPRGSTGYGTHFERAVAGQWGGTAFTDIMDGVDAALAKNSWISKDRLGVVGWSYGGFMTDWIVTQTHRFRAAISIAGISDLESVAGSRDFAYGHARDFGGDVFANRALYRKYSPILYAANVTTPMLFLAGEADERVPPSQSEEFFRALKHFGVPAELVLFPKENHMLPVASTPKHLVESYEWRLYWFRRYVAGQSNAVEPGTAQQEPVAQGR